MISVKLKTKKKNQKQKVQWVIFIERIKGVKRIAVM
jgi:hypothetical protein